jgi:hypothetical protein
MRARCFVSCGLALASMTTLGLAQSPSPNGVKTLNPPGAISPGSDTWSVGARAGDLIFVAGMQGVDPTDKEVKPFAACPLLSRMLLRRGVICRRPLS